MTAYGCSSHQFSLGVLSAEMHSVNKRFLEVFVHLPESLRFCERGIVTWLKSKVARGKLSFSLQMQSEKVPAIEPNIALAKEYKKAWETLNVSLGLKAEQSPFDLRSIFAEKELFLLEKKGLDQDLCQEAIFALCEKVFNDFEAARLQEGRLLQEEMQRRLSSIQEKLSFIEARAEEAPKRYREKLKERLSSYLTAIEEDDERLLKEIAFFAEKIDISEEISRFGMHTQQFAKMLVEHEGALGKALEFLLQEMQREINTIASKSSDVEVSHAAVFIKSEVEKIREQVQNVE